MPMVMSAPPNACLSVPTDRNLEADTHDSNIAEGMSFCLYSTAQMITILPVYTYSKIKLN